MTAPTIAGVGIGGSILGSVIGAFGSFESGQTQAGMYNYQAGVAQLNRQIALNNAEYAMAQGQNEAAQQGMTTRFQLGQAKAFEGASNLDVRSGSAGQVQGSIRKIGQINESNILNNAARTAYGYQVTALQEQEQASLDEMAASQSRLAGDIGAIGSLASGAGNVASKWYQFGSAGGGGLGSS